MSTLTSSILHQIYLRTRSGKILRRILRKIVEPNISDLGDMSTLINPNIVEELIRKSPRTKHS